MLKAILAGTAALAIAGSSLVFAQQRDGGREHGGNRGSERGFSRNFSPEDRAAFTDARIAALKAGLRLSPEQEKNWPAFEAALREIASLRSEQREARREHRSEGRSAARRSMGDFTSPDRIRRHGEMMSRMGEGLKRLADTQEPLYQSLDDAQKNRFRLLARILTSQRPHFAQMRRHGGHHLNRDHDYREHRGDRGPRRMQRMQGDGNSGERL